MRFDTRIPCAIVCLAASALASGYAVAQAPTRDQQMMLEAVTLQDQGKYAEAAAKYEEVIKAFPKVPTVPEAQFRAGYTHYLAGNHDAAATSFKKIIDDPTLPPELAVVRELSFSMLPQVLVAKSAKLEAQDPARRAALEEAVKHFNIYLATYPGSDEAELVNYNMATALSQLERFDDAAKALRENVTKFAASPMVQDSQYSLALTLATMAGKEMARPNPDARAADAQFDEAESLLTDIIGKNLDAARVNDAKFQRGELLSARAGFLRGGADQQKRDAYRAKAIEAYRSVASKERVLAEQKEAVTHFHEEMVNAGKSMDVANFQKFKRLREKATEKLATIEAKPDLAEAARSRETTIAGPPSAPAQKEALKKK